MNVQSIATRPGLTSPDRFLRVLDDPLTLTVAKAQDMMFGATASFWRQREVLNMFLPITTGAVSSPMGLGSDSSPVAIDLLGEQTYLADSMQFLLEYGCRISPGGAWYIMPSFRGEDTDETHLTQFFHSEAELPGDLTTVMTAVEDYLRTLARAALERLSDEITDAAGTVAHVQTMADLQHFPALTLDEATEFLAGDDDAVQQHPAGFRVLTRHGERRLMTEVSPILWVTHFDASSVPFYQAREPGTNLARNADLLFGMGEVVGAGERHQTGEQVRAAMRSHHVAAEDYDWYVRMKDEKPMLTTGFGMGMERWLMWLLNQPDIRELQLVPRLKGVPLAP